MGLLQPARALRRAGFAVARANRSRARRLRSETPSAAARQLVRISGEFAGLALLGTALLAALALATHSPEDPILTLAPVANRAGAAGATLSGWLFGTLGWGAAVVVAAAGWVGGRLVLGRGVPAAGSRFWPGTVMLAISLATLPLLLDGLVPGQLGSPRSGVLGAWLAGYGELLFNSWGALFVSGLLLLLGALSVTGVSTGRALLAGGASAATTGLLLARAARGIWQGVSSFGAGAARGVRSAARRARVANARLGLWREQRTRAAAIGESEDAVEPAVDPDRAWETEADLAPRRSMPGAAIPAARALMGGLGMAGQRRRAGRSREAGPDIVDHERDRRFQPSQESFRFKEAGASGPFRMPDLSIFQAPPASGHGYDRESLLMNSRILEKKLLDFGVRGRVVRVHPGPVITMYEYEPAPGVKVNKIVALSDDLAMALRAISIRIIAPLPGKSVVGIEIPNGERETVYLRTLLDSEGIRNSDAPLMVAMGKDIFGNCVNSDLARMPHLLVAGATGTGKSVFLNAFLCSLIFRTSPEQLKLLLIDPKLLELSIYEGIPHLIADVVTNPKRAAAALAGIVRKMEERYQMMSAVQVRNVEQFNAKADEEIADGNSSFQLRPKPGEVEGEEIQWCRLPYIVVVIDELADLMVLAAKEVEESLQRLAQMARAAGIHLVLATQRPSVDVLTGVIKANFPARVSFQVSSGIDSRTILDQKGAENLLGMGDMLFLPPGTSVVQRLHGPFVTEKEVVEIVAFLRDQGKPVYDDDLAAINHEAQIQEARGDDVDEMFDQAVAIVAETRNASISYLQRRLKIGYNRAARIIEQMENEGMVGPQEGTRPRSVFLRQAGEDEFE